MPTGVKLVKTKVSKAVEGLFVLTEKKLDIVDVPEKINLVVTFKKVPKQQKATTVELKLAKPTSFENQSVCLFVKDLDKDDREYEKTKYHYQALLKSVGVIDMPDIIPIKQLLLEYKAFEAKKNLSNMYDVYLADSRVVKMLPRILGKHFYGRKKIPKRVIMSNTPLEKEIQSAINRCNYVMSMKGSSTMVTVAHRNMSVNDVVANIMAAVKQISDNIPGGAENIRNLYIRTPESAAVPLLVSVESANSIDVPDEVIKEEIEQEPEEITTLEEGQKVQVTKTGDIRIYSKEGKLLSVAEQNRLLLGIDMDKSEKRAVKRKANKSEQFDSKKKKNADQGRQKINTRSVKRK